MIISKLTQPEELKSKTKRRYFSNEELLRRYAVYMRKSNLSVSTHENRRYALKTYLTYLGSINKSSIYKLNGNTLSGYLHYLKSNNFSITSQEFKLKALKAFYNWLKKESIIRENEVIFNGFCVFSYIKELERTYRPEKITQQSAIREEMLPLLDKFEAYYLNKGYSPEGTGLYKREMRRFILYLEENTAVTSVGEITKQLLFEYQLKLHEMKKMDGGIYSLSSKQKKLVIIRKFFQFLLRHDYLEKDPSTIIELPRLDRGIPTQLMNQRELEAFFNAPDLNSPRGLRDRAIIELLYSSGMRNDELCHLKIEDVNLDEGLAKITRAKGGIGFQRVVPIGRVSCNFIRRYLRDARPRLTLQRPEDNPYLFVNNFGARLRKGTVCKYIFSYRLKTNIRNRISAHSFRVTCATDMLKNGADVRYIQEQLGHRSLRSTQIYTRLFPKDLKKVHSQTHPREKTYKENTRHSEQTFL